MSDGTIGMVPCTQRHPPSLDTPLILRDPRDSFPNKGSANRRQLLTRWVFYRYFRRSVTFPVVRFDCDTRLAAAASFISVPILTLYKWVHGFLKFDTHCFTIEST